MNKKNDIEDIYDAIHKENLRYHASLYERNDNARKLKSSSTHQPKILTYPTHNKPVKSE